MINNFIISEIKNYNGIYVETGLSEGDSLNKAISLNFSKLISIEINSEYVKNAKIRFSNEIKDNKVEIINDNSSKALKEVLEKNNNVDVIFLDAHSHGTGQDYAPLDLELDIITKMSKKYTILDLELDIITKMSRKYIIIIDNFYHIKKKIAYDWTKFTDASNIKDKLIKISGFASEVPYSFKGRYNSYLISKKISTIKILYNKVLALFFSTPKNLIKMLLFRRIN